MGGREKQHHLTKHCSRYESPCKTETLYCDRWRIEKGVSRGMWQFIPLRNCVQRENINQRFDQDGCILAEFLFFSSRSWKHRKIMRVISSHLDRTSSVNKIFIVSGKKVSFWSETRMTNLFREPREEADCVCGTINPRGLTMFPFFWLSSAVFCDFIADIFQR